MKSKTIISGLLLVIIVACNDKTTRLEQALVFAGENRAELEKVLSHYAADPSDSLKYRAACYLIENMVGHYERISPSTEKPGRIPSSSTAVKHDLKYITCDYLVRNVDVSFGIWEDVPWRDSISFDDFCEVILPYRIGNEALEDWKETYYRTFRPVIDSVRNSCDMKEICRKLCAYVYGKYCTVHKHDIQSSGLNPLTMLESKMSTCKEQTEFMTYILISLGIPAYMDRIVQNANYHYRAHYWNCIGSPGGIRIYVDFYTVYDKSEDFNKERGCGKIYRTYYKLQPSSLPVKLKEKPVPPTLANPFLSDVSHEYFPQVNITAELIRKPGKGEILYLDVFDGREWKPTGWTEAAGRKKRVRFCHVEPDILYRVSAIREGEQIPLTDPFLLKGNENAHYLRADTSLLQELKLTRKFRTARVWQERLGKAIGGKFQGACRADFSDAVTLYEIVDTVSLGMMAFPVHPAEKYKYVRYVTPESSANSIAELRFLSGGDPLQGKIICSAGQEGQVKEQITDENPLSRFNLERPGSWIGFAFEKPEQITGIRFQYWNDDNSIRKNDEYELYYWANGNWNTLGRQTGSDTHVLEYKNCPSGALFLLHDHTRGREERPFTYKNGKQVWW